MSKAYWNSYVTPYSEVRKEIGIKEWAESISTIGSDYYQNINYFQATVKENNNSIWDFLIILLCVGSFALVTALYRRRFNLLLNTFFNWKIAKQIIRYEKVHLHPVNLVMLIIFILVTPIFFCKSLLLIYPQWEFSSLLKNTYLLLMCYFLVKYAFYQFSAWLFNEHEVIKQYIFQGNLYSKFVGLTYLSLLILLLYSPLSGVFLLKIGLVVLFIFLALQLSRGIIIGIAEKKNLLVIILYLCTLEILPWLLMFKSIQNSL